MPGVIVIILQLIICLWLFFPLQIGGRNIIDAWQHMLSVDCYNVFSNKWTNDFEPLPSQFINTTCIETFVIFDNTIFVIGSLSNGPSKFLIAFNLLTDKEWSILLNFELSQRNMG